MQLIMTDVTLDNCYIKPGSVKFPDAVPRLQVMMEVQQPDGAIAKELINIKVPIDVYQHCAPNVGKEMSISVNVYGKDNGGVGYSYPKTRVPLPVFKTPSASRQ